MQLNFKLEPVIDIGPAGRAATLSLLAEYVMEEALQLLHDLVEQAHTDLAGLRLLTGAGGLKA